MNGNNVNKSAAITKLVVWSVALCLLVGIFSVCMIFNTVGFHGFSFDGGITLLSGYTYSNADEYNIGNMEYTEEIQDIDIEWIAGSVTLKIYDGSLIKVEDSYSGENRDSMVRTRIEDGTLYVKYAASGVKIADDIPSKSLVICLPLKFSAVQLDEIEINTVSADVFIRTSEHVISCRSLEVKSTSGKLCSDGIRAQDASFECVSGDITTVGIFDELEVSSVSGHVQLSLVNDTSFVTVRSVSGDVELTVPSYASFNAEFSSVSGRMQFEGEMVGKNYSHGDGESKYNFKTVSGDVEIILLYE